MPLPNQDNPFAGLDTENLAWVEQQLQAAKAATGGQQQQAPVLSVTLPDGRQVQGTNEQVQQAYQEYYAAQAPKPSQGQQGTQVAQRQEFNQKQFQDAIIRDGREGFKYIHETVYGFDPATVVPTLAKATIELAQQVGALTEEKFRGSHQGLSEQDFGAVKKFAADQGWSQDPKSLENAYLILKGQGVIEKQPINQPQNGQFFQPQTIGANPSPFFSQQGQQGNLPSAMHQTGPVLVPHVGSGSAGGWSQNQEASVADIERMTRGYSREELADVLNRMHTEAVGGRR